MMGNRVGAEERKRLKCPPTHFLRNADFGQTLTPVFR